MRHCETQRGKGLRAKQSDRTRAQLTDKKCKFSAHARAGGDRWTTTSSNPHHNCGKSQAQHFLEVLGRNLAVSSRKLHCEVGDKAGKKGVWRKGRKKGGTKYFEPPAGVVIAAWMRAVMEDADCESRTMLRVDEDGRFNKAVWSFGHSRRGAKFLRSVFAFDATHLSGKYKGVLYIPVGVDANSHLFPLIFMISEGNENKDGWSTFVKLYKDWIGNSVRTSVVRVRGHHPIHCTMTPPTSHYVRHALGVCGFAGFVATSRPRARASNSSTALCAHRRRCFTYRRKPARQRNKTRRPANLLQD